MTSSKPSRRRDGRTATPLGREPIRQRLVAEELVDIRPDVVDGADHAPPRLVGAAREAQRPLHGVVAVVVDLFERLLGDAARVASVDARSAEYSSN